MVVAVCSRASVSPTPWPVGINPCVIRCTYQTENSTLTMKRTGAMTDWSITFEDSAALRGVMEAVSAVVQRVSCRIIPSPDGGCQLAFDCRDPGFTCFLTARLRVETCSNCSTVISFCVECKHLLTAIESPSCSHGCVIIEGNGDKINVRVHDPDRQSHAEYCTLNTFVDEHTPEEMDEMEFDTKIELDIAKLREMLKKAKKTHAEHLRIRVNLLTNGTSQRSLVRFSVHGDAYYSQLFFHDAQQDEGGSLRVRAVNDGQNEVYEDLYDDENNVYDATFPIDKIDAFTKILPCKVIEASVTRGIPLMMTHNFNGGVVNVPDEGSTIRFLIAPVHVDD